jgi:hypothetical protein
VIVVTGPGRSGTSFLAALYRELGMDPGGRWLDPVNAGLEAPDVVRLNLDLMDGLGLAALEVPPALAGVHRAAKRVLPLGSRARLRSKLKRARRVRNEPSLIRWRSMDEVVARHGPRLRELSGQICVAKDPRFCWTLGAWAAAGATIDHVVLSVRSGGAMADSRRRAGHLKEYTDDAVRNSFAYAMGMCMTAITDHRLSYSVVRFPDFIDSLDELYAALALPEEIAKDDLQAALGRLRDPTLVHDWR